MTTRRRPTRSLRKVLNVTDSALKDHPSPESLESLEFSVHKKLNEDNPFTNKNKNDFEDQFERSTSTPFLSKREASYGSLMSLLSETSTQTQSSCSFDEDSEASYEKLSAMLQRVDDALYNNTIPNNMNEKLAEDCLTWSKTFPHFRITGSKTAIHSGYSESENTLKSGLDEGDDTLTINNNFIETIEEQYDNKNEPNIKPEARMKDNSETIERIKEKVINKLVEHLLTTSLEWKNATTLEASKPLRVRTATATTNRERLRPMTAQSALRTSLPPVTSSLRPLEGILVVSSKVLQNRSYLSRPSSSVTRFKPTDYSPPKLHLLRSRLSKLPDNLEDIEEVTPDLDRVLDLTKTATFIPVSNSPVVEERVTVSEPLKFKFTKESKSKERPLSLPPVHAGFKEQGNKGQKKSPTIKNAVLRRHKINQSNFASRPPSAREGPQMSNTELEPMSYHGSLPALPEENNFLKILPIIRNSSAHHSRSRINSIIK